MEAPKSRIGRISAGGSIKPAACASPCGFLLGESGPYGVTEELDTVNGFAVPGSLDAADLEAPRPSVFGS